MAAPSPNAAAKTKKVNVNETAFIDGNTAADNHCDQDSEPRKKIMHSRKAKVMLQQKDDFAGVFS
jgi:hypothetical protein